MTWFRGFVLPNLMKDVVLMERKELLLQEKYGKEAKKLGKDTLKPIFIFF